MSSRPLKVKATNNLTHRLSLGKSPPPLIPNFQVQGTNRFPKAELSIWNLSQTTLKMDEYGCYTYQTETTPKPNQSKFTEACDDELNGKRGRFPFHRQLKNNHINGTLNRIAKRVQTPKRDETSNEASKSEFLTPKARFKLSRKYNTENSITNRNNEQESEISNRKSFFELPGFESVESRVFETGSEIQNERKEITNPLVEKMYQHLLSMNSETKKRIEKYQESCFSYIKRRELELKVNMDKAEKSPENEARLDKQPSVSHLRNIDKAQSLYLQSPVVSTDLNNDFNKFQATQNITRTPIKGQPKEENFLLNPDGFSTPIKKDMPTPQKSKKDRDCLELPKLNLVEENFNAPNNEDIIKICSESVFGRKLKMTRHRKNKSSILNSEDVNKLTDFLPLPIDEKRMSLLMPSSQENILQKKALFNTPKLTRLNSQIHTPAEPVVQVFENCQFDEGSLKPRTTVEKFADLHRTPTRQFRVNMKLFLSPITGKYDKDPSIVGV